MVIHTSALLAIFLAEPERKRFLQLIIEEGTNSETVSAYALAKSTGEPLLAKGTDFTQTDIVVCSRI